MVAEFQSTLPVGGATTTDGYTYEGDNISIHAPRGGSDRQRRWSSCPVRDFNPRSPWGERHKVTLPVDVPQRFQSTLPVGGATWSTDSWMYRWVISIHAPRGGSDYKWLETPFPCHNFNPRSPWGERPAWDGLVSWFDDFNPRSPWGERRLGRRLGQRRGDFNPRSPWGERLPFPAYNFAVQQFQSTLPVGGATSPDFASPEQIIISIHAPRGGSDFWCPIPLPC